LPKTVDKLRFALMCVGEQPRGSFFVVFQACFSRLFNTRLQIIVN
jgi:hypothetical protein